MEGREREGVRLRRIRESDGFDAELAEIGAGSSLVTFALNSLVSSSVMSCTFASLRKKLPRSLVQLQLEYNNMSDIALLYT